MKQKIEIIYIDDQLIVAAKPSDFLSIPDRYAHDLSNMQDYLKQQYGPVLVVHRLDKETSGVICFARNEAAHKSLNEQFQNRTVSKIYFVLVEGHMHEAEGIIDKPIAASQTQAGKMVIAKRGKPSITHFKVVEYFKHFTLVEADIKTGRTHQIRVHFDSIGYPPAIDAVYGRREAFYLSEVKHKKYRSGKEHTERPLMSRTALHASRLELDHPVSGERMQFDAPLPKDFKAVLQQLRKWGK